VDAEYCAEYEEYGEAVWWEEHDDCDEAADEEYSCPDGLGHVSSRFFGDATCVICGLHGGVGSPIPCVCIRWIRFLVLWWLRVHRSDLNTFW